MVSRQGVTLSEAKGRSLVAPPRLLRAGEHSVQRHWHCRTRNLSAQAAENIFEGSRGNPGLEVAALSLKNWSGRKVATIALTWVILVAVFSLWRQFSSSSISRLKGNDSHGFVVLSEQPSPAPIAVAALLPPLILLGAWGASKKAKGLAPRSCN